MQSVFGYRAEELEPTIESWEKRIHPEDKDRAVSSIHDVIDSGGMFWADEYRFRKSDSSYANVMDRGYVVRDNSGKAIRMVGAMLDITLRKASEKEIQKLAAIVTNTSELVNLALPDGTMVFLNDAGCRMLGVDPGKVEEHTIFEAITDDLKAMVQEELLPRVRGGGKWEGELRYKNFKTGEIRDVYATCFSLRDERTGEMLFYANTSYDITQRKDAEKSLRERERVYGTLIDNLPGFVYRCRNDRDWTMQFVSTGCFRVTGYAPEDLIDNKKIAYNDIVTEEYREPLWNKWQKSLADHSYFEEEYPIRTGGGEVRWVWERGRGIFDDNGQLLFLEGYIQEITARKKAEGELETYKDHLEIMVKERTEELESFSYSVSHDLRAPLRAVDGFVHILEEEFADKLGQEGKRIIDVISKSTATMGQLIDNILNLSRLGRREMTIEEIDMEALVKDVVEGFIPEHAGRNVEIKTGHLPKALADRAIVRLAVVNLISNALKFTKNKEIARIEIGADEKKGMIIYYVRDNGVGFDMKYASKLFGAFQRLHSQEEFEGVGIGLAMVKRVIGKNSGRVWAEGEVGKGATFYFSLPKGSGVKREADRC